MILRSLSTMLVLAVALGGMACDGGSADDGGTPSCVERDATACMPLYEPTWDRVFANTIMPRCGTPGSACHGETAAAGAEGGLVVSDAAATHAALLDHGFVEAGDESCSALMVRLDTTNDSLLMPPGSEPLPEAERCAVARWIANGATP